MRCNGPGLPSLLTPGCGLYGRMTVTRRPTTQNIKLFGASGALIGEFMLKKLVIVVAILALMGGIAGAIAGYRLNQTYGWLPSSALTHDVLATPDTRVRVVVDTLRLGKDLEVYLPANLPVPGWLPWGLSDLLPKVLPREIALLGGSDFREGVFNLTLFLNEQRGGPYLPEFLNNQTQFKASTPAIIWDDPGFSLSERGKLTAQGHLVLPDGLESTILESWPLDTPGEPLVLLGGHLAEGAIDNRNGDIVTLIAACAPIWGSSLAVLEANPQFSAALDLLRQVFDIRLAVDFKNPDTVLIQLLLHANAEVRGRLEFMGPFILPMLATEVKRKHGLVMESTYAWVVEEDIYKVDVTLTGVEEKLKESFQGMAPVAPTPIEEAPKSAR